MSSRALKRLQGGTEKELENLAAAAADVASDEGEVTPSKPVHLNPFDLLNQSFSESEVKEDDNETEHASTAANLFPATASKKKKRKRKKKTKYAGNHISSEDNNELTDTRSNEPTIFVGRAADMISSQMKVPQTRLEIDKSLLNVELKNLNPQNEMRRTFGKRVVKIDNKRGRHKLTLKSTHLVIPKDSWPPITKNVIIMKPTSPPDNMPKSCHADGNAAAAAARVQWFAFEHSEYYQNVQTMFLSALEATNSDFLIGLIRRYPYHVDSLIQLSEMCKMTEDYALGSELLERALLVLESALHPSFSLTSGNCYLDYRRQENRSFFVVLFKQAQYLEARACCRTAFELSKLIMNLNPTDPMAMVLVIDYYALRSKQYTWLIKYYEQYDAVRNLSQLPNMAYSYALALFQVHGQCEMADKALQYALLMFPGVLRPLLDELSIQTDQPVVSSSYFNLEVSRHQSPALHQLVCLYVCRAKIIWKQSEMLPWLESNVNNVLQRIAQKDAIIEEYAQKRAARYGNPPRPILRHVVLADFKDKVPVGAFLIKEKSPVMAYDPLPPTDSINFYQRKSSSSSPTAASYNYSVSMFFQSLMPNFNFNNTARPGGGGAGGIPNAVEVAVNQAGAHEAAPAAGAAAAVGAQHDHNVDDDLAELNRHLQTFNANIENQIDDDDVAAADAVANNEAADGGGGAVNAAYGDLATSLNGIVRNLREFLHNFHIAEGQGPIAGVGGDANDSSEGDTTDYT